MVADLFADVQLDDGRAGLGEALPLAALGLAVFGNRAADDEQRPEPCGADLARALDGSCLPRAWNTAAAPSADARSRTRPSASTNTSRDKASAKSGQPPSKMARISSNAAQ